MFRAARTAFPAAVPAAAAFAAVLCVAAAAAFFDGVDDPDADAVGTVAAAMHGVGGAPAFRPALPAGMLPAAAAAEAPAAGPKRSDGFWEMASYNADGSPRMTQSLCVGGGSEERFAIWDQLTVMGDCSRKEIARAGAGWAFAARCELMGTVMESKGTMGGDFRGRFRVDLTVTTNGSPDTGSIRGENKGACPAAFKPGDLVSGGKVLTNVLD